MRPFWVYAHLVLPLAIFIPIFCLTVPIFCVFLFSSLVRQFVTGAGENLPGTYYPLSTITPYWTPPTVSHQPTLWLFCFERENGTWLLGDYFKKKPNFINTSFYFSSFLSHPEMVNPGRRVKRRIYRYWTLWTLNGSMLVALKFVF